ncbi:3-phosphoshikimate 1-carboxyvinyltransferase [Candidatus Koribacter versatilis Ellin345]|nr:3-phosphoshikimate 1-carboxyvinyltransferase [Candidatus Koribacter versatilis Ellin345]
MASDQHSAVKSVRVQPASNILGSVSFPGDKSISHRYGMLAALAEGTSRFKNFSTGADCASTLSCMEQLGAKVTHKDDGVIEVEGVAGQLRKSATQLDCGNSGSSMRMLSGILAAQPFDSELMGDASLSRRPMRRIVDPLKQMGGDIETTDGHAPLRVRGSKLTAIDYITPVPSAQVKSCVLFAGAFAAGITSVDEAIRTRDHGEIALKAFGAEVERRQNRVSVRGGAKFRAIEAVVPGDISSAAFFLCAAALFPTSNLVFDGILLNPSRAAILDVLASMGAKPKFLQVQEQHGELVGTITLAPAGLSGLKISGGLTASLIDELPVLAAIGAYTRYGIEIRDAKELRVKESDRIAVVCANLRAMGAEVEEFDDGLRVKGSQKLHGAEIESHEDHRIAMAFAVAALRAEGETVINGADCVAISYPEFFDTLNKVVER